MDSTPGRVEDPKPQRLRLTFAVRIGLLFIIFIAVPAILYDQFRVADADKSRVLLENVQRQGRLIAEALRPMLDRFDAQTATALNERLARLGDEGGVSVKVLFRPENLSRDSGFFFVASWPAVSAAYLDQERTDLQRTGIFEKVQDSCVGNLPLALRYTNPGGSEELLASLAPVHSTSGCWVLITSNSSDVILSSSLGRPYWRTPVVQVATAIYLAMALVVVWLFADAWRNIRRFEGLARRIGYTGTSRLSFQRLNRIPELDNVAAEFDRMVGTLRSSSDIIRQAAEENAHALKGPVAVIAQAIEPIKRSAAAADNRVARAIGLIEQSVERLDALVSIARRLDEVTAELLDPDVQPIDLSALLRRMVDGYRTSWRDRRIGADVMLEPGVVVEASTDMLETVFENIVDNAASFSPVGGRITVRLIQNSHMAEIQVEDQGPGVAPDRLQRIFERYHSDRPPGMSNGESHFGIGLWIVRRNVQALGGEVLARNRETGGLTVVVRLPLAE